MQGLTLFCGKSSEWVESQVAPPEARAKVEMFALGGKRAGIMRRIQLVWGPIHRGFRDLGHRGSPVCPDIGRSDLILLRRHPKRDLLQCPRSRAEFRSICLDSKSIRFSCHFQDAHRQSQLEPPGRATRRLVGRAQQSHRCELCIYRESSDRTWRPDTDPHAG